MATLIYKAPIRTALGTAEVRITDTQEDGRTPSEVHTRPPIGGIRLQMGDTGSQSTELPTSIGSYFDLQFKDTPDRAFQDLFRPVFDESRFEVELDVPGPNGGTWRGQVKSTLQSRPISRKTRAAVCSVKCYDGIAGLSDFDSVDASTLTVTEFLETVFGRIDADIDILLYTDLEGRSVTGTLFDERIFRPTEISGRSYIPPSVDSEGENDQQGLAGGGLREQLDELCAILQASAYYDLRREVFAVVDVAAIGAGVTSGLRYDGSLWNPTTISEQTLTPANLLNDGTLETLPSLRKACIEAKNWIKDPGFEATSTGSDFLHWTNENSGWDRTSKGRATTSTGDNLYQVLDFSEYDLKNTADGFRVIVERAENTADFSLDIYVNGTFAGNAGRYNSTNTKKDTGYFSIPDLLNKVGDPQINTIRVNFDTVGGTPILKSVKLQFLQKLTNNPVDKFGENNSWRIVDRFCFEGDGDGRADETIGSGGLVLDTSQGVLAAEEWLSKRYSSDPYQRLGRWKAVNTLALRPPEYEELEVTIPQKYAPLGTRIQTEKPGESSKSTFVPLNGRELFFGTSEHSAATKVKDVEIPQIVIDLT